MREIIGHDDLIKSSVRVEKCRANFNEIDGSKLGKDKVGKSHVT